MNTIFAPRSIAVGYVRMSRDVQHESPSQQREHILRLANRIGVQIIRWYEDLGTSGDDMPKRVNFKRMVADASEGEFAMILCWSLDRFGRFDSIEAAEWVAPLRRASVRLITVADGEINWSDSIGRLMYSIQQEAKHSYLLDRAREIVRGLNQRARFAGLHQGPIPYGYDKLIFDERGVFQRRVIWPRNFTKPKPWTAQLALTEDKRILRMIRWMFIAFANGSSLHSIAHALNARRWQSPWDKMWTPSTIRSIIENPVYTGDQVWNRRHCGKYFGVVRGDVVSDEAFAQTRGAKKPATVLNSVEDWVVVRRSHPAIIDRKVFDRAQSRLPKRTGRTRPASHDPLVGLVFCGHCRRPMHITPGPVYGRDGRRQKRRVVCRTASEYGRAICKSRSIGEPELLCFLCRFLRDRVFDGLTESALRKEVTSYRHDVPSVQRSGRRPTSEELFAKTMAELTRLRIALVGNDWSLLREATHTLIARVELWFGQHPTRRIARTLTRGTLQLKAPFGELLGHSGEIAFARKEFDLLTSGIDREMQCRLSPPGYFEPKA